jgi:gliding motility-associated-like protein
MNFTPTLSKFILTGVSCLAPWAWVFSQFHDGDRLLPQDNLSAILAGPSAGIEVPSESDLKKATAVPGTVSVFPTPDIDVSNVCQYTHSTLVAVPNVLVANSTYEKAVWVMGDGTTYTKIRPANDQRLNYNWMHTLHSYMSSGNYTLTLTLFDANGNSASVTKTIFAAPTPGKPQAVDTLDICLGSPLIFPAGSVVPSTGCNLVWVTTDPTNSALIRSRTPPTGVMNTLGVFPYKVLQELNGCESMDAAEIKVVVTGQPAPPVVTPSTFCQDQVVQPLSLPSTNNLFRVSPVWYDSPTGPELPGAPTPNTSAGSVPGRNYYVSLRSTRGCGESGKVMVPITILPSPAAPAVTVKDLCEGAGGALDPHVTFTAGHTARWWGTQSTGGSWTSSSPPLPTTLAPGTTVKYYVSQVSNTTGCGSSRSEIVVNVRPNPSATLTGDATVCQNAASPQVVFTGSAGTAPFNFKYRLDGGALEDATTTGTGNSFTVSIPTASSGQRNVQLVSVTDAYGCMKGFSLTSNIRILEKPDAVLAGPAEACGFANTLLSFTGSKGLPPYTFHYGIDNGALQTLTSTGTSSITSLNPALAPPGSYVYKLRKVSYTVSGTTCEQDLSQDHPFNVLSSPEVTASILNQAGTTLTLCQNSPSPTVVFGITQGEAPYTLAYRYQGSLQQVPIASGQTTLSFPISTVSPGKHEFQLVEIRDSKNCRRSYTDIGATVNVLGTPEGSINGTTQLCMFAGTAPVTFSGTGGKAPYAFTYSINGGVPQTISTVGTGSTVTLQAPSDQAGAFEYKLLGVSYQDGITCSKDLASTAIVTINPSPVSPIVTPAAFCLGTTGASLPSLTPIPGTTLRWYGTSATGGSWTATSPTPPTGTAGLTSYYVSQHNPTTGCESQRSEIPVRIHPLPTASFSAGTVVCQAAQEPLLTLTGAGGTAPYTFTYRIDNGPNLSASTAMGSATTQVAVPTANASTLAYELLGVSDGNGCRQSQTANAVFRVLATPDAILSAPAEVCVASSSSVTFTASAGKAPYTFSYTLNGGAEQTVSSSNGSTTAQVAIPAALSGPQVFRLTRVTYADGETCSKSLAQDATVTVNPLPFATASIAGQTANSLLLCQDAPSPSLLFSGSSGTAPYTFHYRLNGIAQTATTTTGASYSKTVPTTDKGTFEFELTKVSDTKGCAQNVTGTAMIRILSTPGGSIQGSVKLCEKDAEPLITFKGSSGTRPYSFTYSINGGADQRISTSAGDDIATLRAPTTIPGTFTYRLKEVSYSDGITCPRNLAEDAVVTVHDLPRASITSSGSDIDACQFQPSPEIRFNGQGGKPPYTFRYRRNNDILLSTGNPFVEKAQTRVEGITRYELLEVQDANLCRQSQTANILVRVWPTPVVDAGPDKIILENASITLDGSASNGNGLRFQWTPSNSLNDPSILKPLARPAQETRYLLTVTTDKGCSDTSSMLLKVLFKPAIPNTFTPNGDGYNDRWEILNLGAYPDPIVEIYNDRGLLLMRSTGTYRPWDGTYKGMPLPAGTYYYVIHPRSGRDRVAGYITILR